MFARNRKKQSRNKADQQSKKVYSYYSNTRIRDEQPDRDRQNSPVKRSPGAQNWWHNVPSALALLVIVVCFGYVLSINSNPKIVQTANDQGIFLQDKDTYQQAANKIISQSILNNNKVTLNVAGISHAIKQQFPELTDVSVTIPLINRRPVIYISASKPTLLLMSKNDSMLVDNRGIAILPATKVAKLSKYKLLPVKDDSGLVATAGKAALPTSDVKFISSTYKQLVAASQPVDSFILPPKANELDVKLTGLPYYLKMDMTADSREQVGAFVAAEAKLKSLNNLPSEYIDLRVLGRIYYK